MIAGKTSLVLNAISITREAENKSLPIADKIFLAKAAKGPVRRMGLEHVMNVYVIWKFAENKEGAKKFLVDYVGDFHRAFEASEFYNFPCFQKQVPDLKQLLQHDSKGKPPDKYAVLADSLDWATNVGYPGYANAAIDDIYSNWIVNNMFAKAAQGVMSPEDAVKEAEATNSLIDQGVDVLTCHVDGPKTMVENAARRGAMVCGYHVNQSPLAPKAYLTGAEWNWEALYPKFVKMIAAGEAIPNFYRGGLKEEIVKCSPYGEAVSAEARKHADDIKAKLTGGEYTIFKGPIMDNKGNAVIAAGTGRGQKDPELEKMDYLVEGVIGATS